MDKQQQQERDNQRFADARNANKEEIRQPRYELDNEDDKHGDLKKLQEQFVTQKDFSFEKEIEVGGIRYSLGKSTERSMLSMMSEGKKGMIAYGTRYTEQAEAAGLGHYLVFLWSVSYSQNVLVPSTILGIRKTGLTYMDTDQQIDKLRSSDAYMVEDESKISIDKAKVIGTTVEVIISNLADGAIVNAKVDTGADISSIHADEWSVNNGQVTFTNPEISQNKITMPVIEKQAIKSSNGDIEYRPVVSLNIKVNGIPLSDVMFNLNDRGSMTYSMLVGKNILERGGFMIDPKLDEAVETITESEMMDGLDLDALQDQIKDMVFETTEQEKIKEMLEYINKKIG